MNEENFYTHRGYSIHNPQAVSPAMEDYLEMIYRCMQKKQYVRINQLAQLLNVTPPSSSKMVTKLKEQGFVDFEPYGIITLTEKGKELGAYLLKRHIILNRFFCLLNQSTSELELVEKIEHFFDTKTIENLENLIHKLENTAT